MTATKPASSSVESALLNLQQKLLTLHESKARELEKVLKEIDEGCEEKATSITIGSKLMCPTCSELQRVVKVKEDPDIVAVLASGKSRGKDKADSETRL